MEDNGRCDEYAHLVKTLAQFHSVKWMTQYFDLLKRLVIELGIENGDPRLAMSLNGNKTLPVNLGQRYVMKPIQNQYVRCIVPVNFAEEAVGGEVIFEFTRRGEVDAKWIEVHYPVGSEFPPVLYYACVDACADVLRRCRRSGFRKFHSELLYNFVMEPAVRHEILGELKPMR